MTSERGRKGKWENEDRKKGLRASRVERELCEARKKVWCSCGGCRQWDEILPWGVVTERAEWNREKAKEKGHNKLHSWMFSYFLFKMKQEQITLHRAAQYHHFTINIAMWAGAIYNPTIVLCCFKQKENLHGSHFQWAIYKKSDWYNSISMQMHFAPIILH